MLIKRKKKQNGFLPLDEIKKINDAYLDEIDRVKTRLKGVNDKDLIDLFFNVLREGYSDEIEIKALEREVDYEIKFAEISERRRNLKPWRRCWLWKLLGQPLTNRAQDIIEERAELDADFAHTAAENAIDSDRSKFTLHNNKQGVIDEARKKIDEIIKAADKADLSDVLNEETATERSETREPAQVQLKLSDLPRPRPPRSCRKPPTQKQ